MSRMYLICYFLLLSLNGRSRVETVVVIWNEIGDTSSNSGRGCSDYFDKLWIQLFYPPAICRLYGRLSSFILEVNQSKRNLCFQTSCSPFRNCGILFVVKGLDKYIPLHRTLTLNLSFTQTLNLTIFLNLRLNLILTWSLN